MDGVLWRTLDHLIAIGEIDVGLAFLTEIADHLQPRLVACHRGRGRQTQEWRVALRTRRATCRVAIRFLHKVRVSSKKFSHLSRGQANNCLSRFRGEIVWDLPECTRKLKTYIKVASLVIGIGGALFVSIAIDSHVLCNSDDMEKR